MAFKGCPFSCLELQPIQLPIRGRDQLHVLAVTLHIRRDERTQRYEARAAAFDLLERELDELTADALPLEIRVDLGMRLNLTLKVSRYSTKATTRPSSLAS